MASDVPNVLSQFSATLADRVASARPLIAEIHIRGRRPRSGTLWRKDVVVASEQALGDAQEAEVVLAGASRLAARLAGRDPGTNVAVLRVEGGPQPAWSQAGEPRPGALALALGADGAAGISARLGVIHSVGPAWHSRAGGHIDRRIGLDIRLGGGEEGGPVLDAAGGLIGISTLGPRRRVMVIPAATVERVLDPLLAVGRVARGWLGIAVQPVLVPERLRSDAGQTLGLMVIGVTPDGPAAQAGVLMGDILIAIDGAGVGGASQLAGVLGPESLGRQVQLRLIRAGAVQNLSAIVAARPER